jgi:hypothetical protein
MKDDGTRIISVSDEDVSHAGEEPSAAHLRARAACENVITTYFRLVDAGAASRVVGLYAEGGELVVEGHGVSGQDLESAMLRREQDVAKETAHVPAFLAFELSGPVAAHAVTYFHHYLVGREPLEARQLNMLGVIEDDFVLVGGKWRIKRREMVVVAGVR